MNLLSLCRGSSARSIVSGVVAVLVIGAAAVALGACSTTEGFGEDVKNLGSGIEDSAERNK